MNKIALILVVLVSFYTQAFTQPTLRSKPVKWIDANGKVFMNAEWSPDGQSIAFTGEKNNGIYVCNADGLQIKQVTDDVNSGFRFSWSQDGMSLLARPVVIEDGKRFYEIVTYNLRTNDRHVLMNKTRHLRSIPRWVDGDAYVAVKQEGKIIKLATGKPALKQAIPDQVVTIQNEVFVGEKDWLFDNPEFMNRIVFNLVQSPDKSKVVFQVNGLGIYVANADGSELKHLGFAEQAVWTPDGKYVIVAQVKDDGRVITTGDIIAINVNTAETYPLLKDSSIIALNPSVSPDGSRVLIDNLIDGSIYMFEINQ